MHPYWTVWKPSCKKTIKVGPQKIFFHQDNALVHFWADVTKLMGVYFPLPSRFGSHGLLPIPQNGKMAAGKDILFKRGCDCGNKCLLGEIGILKKKKFIRKITFFFFSKHSHKKEIIRNVTKFLEDWSYVMALSKNHRISLPIIEDYIFQRTSFCIVQLVTQCFSHDL